MSISNLILETARHTIAIEAATLEGMKGALDHSFVQCVEALYRSPGRLVVTGIGKSAIVAQKIVATLNSTGTPALFMHAADAIHGDLGMIRPDDWVMCLSKSGDTAEIKVLAPLVKQMGNPLIGMTSRTDSFLARQSDFLLHTPVSKEADPNNLAPTASTTAQMAMGDAIATALLAVRGFTSADFAQYHPGGALGKQLYLRVSDLYTHNQRPQVLPETPLQETIIEMTAKCLGATAVTDADGQLRGIITDGDLRRMLTHGYDMLSLKAADVMYSSPRTIVHNALAVEALEKMRSNSISQLIVVDEEGAYLGFVHLHDLVREGLI
ncbi:MAG: KpsF/GutQ family sugar-phosphate isomerase [Saprospiraceae bacterium]